MRIITGNLKGRKILFPDDKKTRPLRDLVKESIFNLIEHSQKFNVKIKDSNVLDLFAGSGSFGLECLSRGSKKVVFIEIYFQAIKTLKTNINNLNIDKKCKVIEKDFLKEPENFKYLNEKFNIIFLDPPFKEKKIYELLDLIGKANILEKNGVIIIHRNKKDKDIFPDYFKIEIERSYGLSKVFFLKI